MDNDAVKQFEFIYDLVRKIKNQRDFYQREAESFNKNAPELSVLSKLSDECHVAYFDLLDILKTL